jgi:nucleoside-diphosphate-sugar epimerase
VLARRAAEEARHALEVIAVSRFGDGNSRQWLQSKGVQTVCCDLLDRDAMARLPDAENIIYLVGLKFGTSQNPANTWATNTLVPAIVCERYPASRMAALSTGNVYPLTEVKRGGSVETDPLTPLGEYANAAVGRERIFSFCSARYGTRVALLRLCYAIDLRYGVLSDIARKVYARQTIDLSTGSFNCIWQRDANELILRSLPLAQSPPSAWNLCRPEIFSVRDIAIELGQRWGRTPQLSGRETETALLTNPARLCETLGTPLTRLETMLNWTAQWVESGGRDLGKPTHFETRDGQY